MGISRSALPWKWLSRLALAAVTAVVLLTSQRWYPRVNEWVQRVVASRRTEPAADSHGHGAAGHGEEGHAAHGHSHAEHESLELSPAALRNLGLTPEYVQPVSLSTYRRHITVPAIVAERPGRTRLQVATPMTGVVTHVHAVEGEAVEPGTLLFQIRLTHEDLVQAQTVFLQTIGELDVERREIDRLTEVIQSGAVPRVKLLEREYERDKLEAHVGAQREALRLHGLSEEQVDRIASERRLLRELQVFAPEPDEHLEDEFDLVERPLEQVVSHRTDDASEPVDVAHSPLVISELKAHKGQSLAAGETLCVLADYSRLDVEGMAFEQDAPAIAAALARNWSVSGLVEHSGEQSHVIDGLQIVRLSNEVDPDSRTLRFYVRLPNEVETRSVARDGSRFIGWRYRPGQRMQLRVPVEEWKDQIVLPVDAVVKSGAEYYVFQQNGSHFDRVAVHVRQRDQVSVVIANDGTLFPGDVVAWKGAHQMLMALRAQSGQAVDPHPGHSH